MARLCLPPALVCLAMSGYLAFRVPLFFGADETAHFSYVAALLDGRLPEITDVQAGGERFPILAEAHAGVDDGSRSGQSPIFVANHPPLAYVVAAPVVWAARLGGDAAPALAMRLVNGLAMSAGVVLTGLFAAEVFPRGRMVAFVAATIAAVTPALVGVAAYGHSDGAGFAVAAAGLWLAARLLRPVPPSAVPSVRLLGAAAAMTAVALLTRAALATTAALLVAAAATAVWRHQADRDRLRRRLVTVRVAALVAAPSVVLAGWFYVRNWVLYGSPTADDLLLRRAGRRSPGSLVEVLVSGDFPGRMGRGLYGSVHPRLVVAHAGVVTLAVVAVGVAGGALALARATTAGGRSETAADPGPFRRRSAADTASPAPFRGGSAADAAGGRGLDGWGWALVGAYGLAVVVGTASFFSEGGSAHPRYFLPLVPVASALVARALAELPARRLAALVTVGGLAAVVWSQARRYPDLVADRYHMHPFDDAAAGGPAQAVALAVAGLAVAAVVAVLLGAIRTVDWPAGGAAPAPVRPATADRPGDRGRVGSLP
ncbi:MAG TPA: hypothetical protein VK306_06470 [Acidimicrobiales bacterium]|nr:hypothetical protein [Acidimicrobiales bacterium]